MKVTLTFDNGPSETTGEVLDVLAARGVKSTFFVVGAMLGLPGARDYAERAAAEGHWIGNHTLTHSIVFGDSNDPTLPEREIGQTQALLGSLAHPNKLFRPYAGGGIMDDRMLSGAAIDYLQEHEYTCVLWNCLPHDWDQPDQWVPRCLEEIRDQDWSVVLVHDLPTGAMRHLPEFLDQLEKLDVEIVQEFPESCLPIRNGNIVGDLSAMSTT